MPNLRRKLPSANALFVFEAAARCGNFTRAAQELYVSQPAVSRMLARMEDHIGVRLFERVHGGIELTESGKILYHKISEGFSGIESAIREIEARATGIETVTLSVSTGFTTHWLMPRMSRLNQAFPSVDLRFQLISGRIGGPLVDVDLGMRFLHDEEIDEYAVLVMPEMLLPLSIRVITKPRGPTKDARMAIPSSSWTTKSAAGTNVFMRLRRKSATRPAC